MTPLIHVGLAQHPKKGSGAQSLTMVNSDLVGLWWPTMSLLFYCIFVYNISNMLLYYMSCIICLNEIYFIYVLDRKPGSISRGLWSS